MVVILKTEEGEIELSGRTLAIIEELLVMQEEIEETFQGDISVDWKGKGLRVALTKYRVRKRKLAD